ncbi:ribosomal-processing cysteine protease Prp [Thermohalobacter berrensis]|uniref:Ribosomal processing cysteine protease Prp n=1 Tax=Thermohalobacter berrensis TaxID=99594 RepID=A0A419T4Y1_9FIRM|nr:ribosomal-processing cysteine protease Prp [Thermohalobacter berrensis]RKD32489.1 hypothetical protein BET03_11305 [Thermohalobacter berrensis]
MTKVRIFTNDKGKIIKYIIKGHTGFERSGRDILCSAVSTLSQTALIALNEVCDIPEKDIDFKVEDGYLEVNIPRNLDIEKRMKTDIVLDTMLVGIKALIKEYPEYLTLEFREVKNNDKD